MKNAEPKFTDYPQCLFTVENYEFFLFSHL